MSIHEKPEIALAVALAVPAIFLNRKFGLKITGRIKIKAVGQGRIEEVFAMLEMVEVAHGQHARPGAGKNFLQQMVNVAELHFQLVEHGQVILAQRAIGGERPGRVFQRAGHIKDYALPPEFAFGHRLPVACEPFVARTLCPDILKPLRLLLIPEQFGFVVRIGKVLNLQPLVFVQRSQQQAELFLKFIQVGDGTVGEVRRFKDKTFGDITAAPQMVEHHQIAHKKTVGWTLKHKSDALGFAPLHVVHYLLDAVQVIHELLDGADRFAFVDGDVGFLNVRPCPLHVRAGGVTEAACVMQTGTQRGFGGGELA